MLQQLVRKVRYLGWNKCEVNKQIASFSRMMTYLDVLTIFFYLSSFLVTTNTKIKILTIIFSGFESIFILLKNIHDVSGYETDVLSPDSFNL